MTWVGVAVAGATLVSGAMSSRAASKAADAQRKSGDAAIDEQRAGRISFEERTEPFRQLGLSAATPLLQSLGIEVPQEFLPATEEYSSLQNQIDEIDRQIESLPIGQDPNKTLPKGLAQVAKYGSGRSMSPENIQKLQDLQAQRDELSSQLENTPRTDQAQSQSDYFNQELESINPLVSFLRDEGFNQIQEQAAAQGNLRSGGTLKDLTRFNTQLASTVVPQLQQQRFNQLFNLLGIGQNAAVGQGSAALSTASNIGNILQNTGAAQAQNAINQGNIAANTISDLAGVGGYALANRRPDPFFTNQSGYQFNPGTDPFSAPQGGF